MTDATLLASWEPQTFITFDTLEEVAKAARIHGLPERVFWTDEDEGTARDLLSDLCDLMEKTHA